MWYSDIKHTSERDGEAVTRENLTMSVSAGDLAGDRHNFDLEHRRDLPNVIGDPSDNITIRDTDMNTIYHDLFDAALSAYNDKQVEKGHAERVIQNYYDKIAGGKQEKVAYECVIQLGNKDTNPANDQECVNVSREIYIDFVREFEKCYPSMKVAQAVIHNDEATPHLHMVYVPVSHNNKRGLETRVSMRGALRECGFTDVRDWNRDVFATLERVSQEHGITRLDGMAEGRRHQSVRDFKAALNDPDYPYHNDPELLHMLDEQQAWLEDAHEVVTQQAEVIDRLAEAKIGVTHIAEVKELQEKAKDVTQKTRWFRMELDKAIAQLGNMLAELPQLWREHVTNPLSHAIRTVTHKLSSQERVRAVADAIPEAGVSVSHGASDGRSGVCLGDGATVGGNGPQGPSEGR